MPCLSCSTHRRTQSILARGVSFSFICRSSACAASHLLKRVSSRFGSTSRKAGVTSGCSLSRRLLSTASRRASSSKTPKTCEWSRPISMSSRMSRAQLIASSSARSAFALASKSIAASSPLRKRCVRLAAPSGRDRKSSDSKPSAKASSTRRSSNASTRRIACESSSTDAGGPLPPPPPLPTTLKALSPHGSDCADSDRPSSRSGALALKGRAYDAPHGAVLPSPMPPLPCFPSPPPPSPLPSPSTKDVPSLHLSLLR
mmetsp:Transcript_17361/g.37333  ORF Transcript_17361/g.37333 Transcript_17361/m.37333 type:complete len:258 (-) Transcript_17361:910-1683(-)